MRIENPNPRRRISPPVYLGFETGKVIKILETSPECIPEIIATHEALKTKIAPTYECLASILARHMQCDLWHFIRKHLHKNLEEHSMEIITLTSMRTVTRTLR
jgi:hypothetical protein